MVLIANKLRSYLACETAKHRPLARLICKTFRCRRTEGVKNSKTSKLIGNARTQCNVYISQRLRRLHRLYLLYQQVYSDYGKLLLLSPVLRRLFASRPLAFALTACGFQWIESGISSCELQAQVDQILKLQQDKSVECRKESGIPSHWENLVNEPEFKMWKYPSEEPGLMEYTVHGTFTDISAKTFFNVQLDTEYRRQWDHLVLKLDVIDENPSRNEQVLQWITRMSYPFSHREYVFVRRTLIDDANNVMVISSKATSHPSCQPCKDYVRVTTYVSHMVIKPHKSFNDLGFDYIMTYCDDPQLVLPRRVSTWAATAGIPDYLKRVHSACLNFRKTQVSERENKIPCLVN